MKNCVVNRECLSVYGRLMMVFATATLSAIVLGSCATVTPDMLRPELVQTDQRVLPLEFVEETAEVSIAGTPRNAVFQSDFYTIFDRELRQNLYIAGEEPVGTIDITITFFDERTTVLGSGLAFFGGLTLLTAPLLGVPIMHGRLIYEVEVTVRSPSRREIWHGVFGYEETGFMWIYNYFPDGVRQARIRAFHALAQDVRIALSDDSEMLNRQLRSEM